MPEPIIQPASEFPTTGHRTNHMAALVREREGYEAKAKAAETTGDTAGAEAAKNRASQVATEIKRVADSARARPNVATR